MFYLAIGHNAKQLFQCRVYLCEYENISRVMGKKRFCLIFGEPELNLPCAPLLTEVSKLIAFKRNNFLSVYCSVLRIQGNINELEQFILQKIQVDINVFSSGSSIFI